MDAEQKITSLKIDGFQGVLKNSVCNGKFVIEIMIPLEKEEKE